MVTSNSLNSSIVSNYNNTFFNNSQISRSFNVEEFAKKLKKGGGNFSLDRWVEVFRHYFGLPVMDCFHHDNIENIFWYLYDKRESISYFNEAKDKNNIIDALIYINEVGFQFEKDAKFQQKYENRIVAVFMSAELANIGTENRFIAHFYISALFANLLNDFYQEREPGQPLQQAKKEKKLAKLSYVHLLISENYWDEAESSFKQIAHYSQKDVTAYKARVVTELAHRKNTLSSYLPSKEDLGEIQAWAETFYSSDYEESHMPHSTPPPSP
jgi:hypothetical protein